MVPLVLCARRGDRRAIEELIGRYQGRIARFVVSQTSDTQQYEDLCQVIFVKMVLNLTRLQDPERFEPWLFQIARNACRDHLRRQRGWRRLFTAFEPAYEAIAASPPVAGDERTEDVARGLARLPADQATLLRLSLEGDRSYEELAALSETSVPAVKSRLHRARRSLRQILFAGEAK
jgi:RNA polymerase sigma-70 factor (ECF subfamily)